MLGPKTQANSSITAFQVCLVRGEAHHGETRVFKALGNLRIQSLLCLTFVVRPINIDQGLVLGVGEVGPRIEFLKVGLSPVWQVVTIRLQIIEPVLLKAGGGCVR